LPKKDGGVLIKGWWYTEYPLEQTAPNIMGESEILALERMVAEGLRPAAEGFGR
jgi:hypothetical protein